MTAELPGELRDLATHAPAPAELAYLELVLSGAFAPLPGFLDAADTASVQASGTLADGTPWPVPVTLTIPKDLAGEDRLVLADPEGVPLAVLNVSRSWETAPGLWRLAGPVESLRAPEHGPFRRLRHRPGAVRAELSGRPAVFAVATREPLHRRDLGQIRQLAEKLESPVLVLACLPVTEGGSGPIGEGGGDALVRALLAVQGELPQETRIIPVPLPEDPHRDLLLRAHVAAAYGATHLMADEDVPGAPVTVLVPEPWAYDTEVEVWRPTARIEPDHVREGLTSDKIADLLDRGETVPEWFTPPAVATELRRARPSRRDRGVTVFFTGLSGSGKSTLARGLADALTERGRRVSLLDGDVVRRMLSAGLTFSRADRDLNIRRIGYVAAEITRHGGIAICAPIAPYAATRAEVRRMAEAAGDFVLVHVSTPLAECERRDRKGLYAKARAGMIPEFTGISDPYEEPDDAELTIDTSATTPDDAVADVLSYLVSGGWIGE